MSQLTILFASVLTLPLYAQQQQIYRKPSPFPEKNRQESLAAEARSSRSARPARVKPGITSRPGQTATTGVASKQTGKACFFSSATDGALTASGSRLNAAGLVAAHATYALGSRVKVTNLANGKSVEVQIVDRFPVSGRIINVSEAVARQLGFVELGTADVELNPVQQNDVSGRQ